MSTFKTLPKSAALTHSQHLFRNQVEKDRIFHIQTF